MSGQARDSFGPGKESPPPRVAPPRTRKGSQAKGRSHGKSGHSKPWQLPKDTPPELLNLAECVYEFARELTKTCAPLSEIALKVRLTESELKKQTAVMQAVFRSTAPLCVDFGRFKKPWKKLKDVEKGRLLSALKLHRKAFDAILEDDLQAYMRRGMPHISKRDLFYALGRLPDGVDTESGRFTIDWHRGKKAILCDFEKWFDRQLQKRAVVHPARVRRMRNRDGPADWLRCLRAKQFLEMHGRKKTLSMRMCDVNGNYFFPEETGSPIRSERQLKEAAKKAERILGEIRAEAEAVFAAS